MDDISKVFLRYLHSTSNSTPFSPEPLSPESLLIIRHLERLINKGWWTVGSQPAIDGVNSSDEVVGWGPKGGYVYQKCFVEFFVEKEDIDKIEEKVRERGQGWVDYFAGNLEVRLNISFVCLYCLYATQGECRTNVSEGGRNAVTWGVFPGQEVAQSTIIEKESFLAWKVRRSLFFPFPLSDVYKCRRRHSLHGQSGLPITLQTPQKGKSSRMSGSDVG